MALFMVATPIGNTKDFSQRALEILKNADLIVGEELKALRQILKAAGVQGQALDQLNEHSDEKDVAHFLNECSAKNVALVSDCGTPGFCDPGAELAAACHTKGIAVHAVPGASSLMALLAVSGVRVESFHFLGFLPAKSEARAQALKKLAQVKEITIFLETPYRAEKLVQDLTENCADQFCVLGLDLTSENEKLVRALGKDLKKFGPFGDRQPIAMILPRGFKL